LSSPGDYYNSIEEAQQMTAAEATTENQFKFDGVMVERVIVHRIFPRSADKEPVNPNTSSLLVTLPQAALDTLQQRIQHALGNKSHGIEMSIAATGAQSFFQTAASMTHATEKSFIDTSKALAYSLSAAQQQTNAPGGMLAVIAGRVGENA
jgi:hypothetical protein